VSYKSLILVVEDNEANQLLVRAVLELDGHRVDMAGSAPEAHDQIRACAPDLILMDVQLPGQDGLALTRDLKADPATADIPVVALTAHAMTGDRELALRAGCIGYISKPIDTRTFGSEVGQFLAKTSHDEQAVAG
jgi:CheY-like chemotaxis protein